MQDMLLYGFFSLKHKALFLLPIIYRLQCVVSRGKTAFRDTISYVWNLIHSRNYNRQNLDYERPTITLFAYRDFLSCGVIFEFCYCSGYWIINSIKAKEAAIKLSMCAHVSLKYRQRIFYWLLRTYSFFFSNFHLNLVKKKFPIKGTLSEFTANIP